jgi:hypothetical protein
MQNVLDMILEKKFIWRVVQVSFNIKPHLNINHLFNGWRTSRHKKLYVGPFGFVEMEFFNKTQESFLFYV